MPSDASRAADERASKRAFRGERAATTLPAYPTLQAFDASSGRRAFLRRLVGLLWGGVALAAGAEAATAGQHRPSEKPPRKQGKKGSGKQGKQGKKGSGKQGKKGSGKQGKQGKKGSGKQGPRKRGKKDSRKKPRRPRFIRVNPGYPPSRRARLDTHLDPG